MDDNFSPRVKDVIAFSKEEALDWVITLLVRNILCWGFCEMEEEKQLQS